MAQVVQVLSSIPRDPTIQEAECEISGLRRQMAAILREDGVAGLSRFKDKLRLMLAWGVVGGADLRPEVIAAAKLGEFEGWKGTGSSSGHDDDSDTQVKKLRAKLSTKAS